MSSVRHDSSRCARLRSSTAACGKCLAACPAAAVQVTGSIEIDGSACTDCGCCVAACPTEALRWEGPLAFGRMLARVARRERSVIGCSKAVAQGRLDAGSCLGWLGEEHLCALASVAPNGLQLDLTPCAGCRNGHVPGVLKDRLAAAQRRSALPVRDRIALVTESGRCWQDANCVGRRQLFGLWREVLAPEIDGFPPENPYPLTHSKQVLPARRKILRWVADRHGEAVAASVGDSYHGILDIGSGCDGCGACVAVCPCAALDQQDNDSHPVSEPSRCVRCGACESFCAETAIRLRTLEEQPAA